MVVKGINFRYIKNSEGAEYVRILRMPQPPYTCPRCGYETRAKSSMEYHLLRKQKLCSPLKSNMVLTDQVKSIVMEHRVYQDQCGKDNQKEANQQRPTLDFLVDYIYNEKREAIESSNIQPLWTLDNIVGHLLKVIMEGSQQGTIHVAKTKRMMTLFMDPPSDEDLADGEVSADHHFLFEAGQRKIVKALQDRLWDAYEISLIRRIEGGLNLTVRRDAQAKLELYYSVLAAIEADPFVGGDIADNKIRFDVNEDAYWNECDQFELCDRYTALYARMKNELKSSRKNAILRQVKDAIMC